MPRYTRSQRAKMQLDKPGYSQQDLADAIGYSRPYVSNVLNGARSPECMKQIEAQLVHWQAVARNEWRRAHEKRNRR